MLVRLDRGTDNRYTLGRDFAGATEAVSEVGGYSVDIHGQRVYLLQTAEKGMAWLRLVARGTAGHGSQLNSDNPVTKLAAAVARALAEIAQRLAVRPRGLAGRPLPFTPR